MKNVFLIKNMVCHRCLMTVESILKKATIPFEKVMIGEIHLNGEITAIQKQLLQSGLENLGFEMIETHLSDLIEKIKQHTNKKARNKVSEKEREKENKMNLSDYLSAKLHYEYTLLGSFFRS